MASAAPNAAVLSMPRVQSLAEQAADAIVAGVYSGALKPGERLYETELAGLLKMSRVPLREALKILEAQGIVESVPHRGTYVALFGEEQVVQICEARVALERVAIQGAARRCRADPQLLAGLDAILMRMELAADRLDWIEVSKADLDFHREICRVGGNDIVTKLWESLARHVFIVFGQESRGKNDADVIGPQHRELKNVILSGDTKALDEEIERHVMRLMPAHRKI